YLFPIKDDVFYYHANRWFKQRYRIIKKAKLKFSKISSRKRSIKKKYDEILHFFHLYTIDQNYLDFEYQQIISNLKNRNNMLNDVRKSMNLKINHMEMEIKKSTRQSFNDIYQVICSQKEKINEMIDLVKIEANRLGK